MYSVLLCAHINTWTVSVLTFNIIARVPQFLYTLDIRLDFYCGSGLANGVDGATVIIGIFMSGIV